MNTVYFSFNSVDNARSFVGAVLDHGARAEDVSVVAREGVAWNRDGSDTDPTLGAKDGLTTTTGADAGAGAAAGAGVGLGVGILAGLASLFIPGVGLVVGGGALATAIGGAIGAAGAGAVAGGVLGYLRDMGVPSEVSEDFESDYNANHVIVGVAATADGISPTNLWTLAEKYHATRTSEARPSEFSGRAVDTTTTGATPYANDPVARPGDPLATDPLDPLAPRRGNDLVDPI